MPGAAASSSVYDTAASVLSDDVAALTLGMIGLCHHVMPGSCDAAIHVMTPLSFWRQTAGRQHEEVMLWRFQPTVSSSGASCPPIMDFHGGHKEDARGLKDAIPSPHFLW